MPPIYDQTAQPPIEPTHTDVERDTDAIAEVVGQPSAALEYARVVGGAQIPAGEDAIGEGHLADSVLAADSQESAEGHAPLTRRQRLARTGGGIAVATLLAVSPIPGLVYDGLSRITGDATEQLDVLNNTPRESR